MKSLIKAGLRKLGFDIVRYDPELRHPFAVLPLLVRERLATGGPFFFLQVGANDGVMDDPLHDLILEHRLRGLLVEPLPDIFERLKQNYAGQDQLIFDNVAVGDHDGETPMYRVKKDAPLAPFLQGIASFRRGHLRQERVPDRYIETLSVKTATIPTLLKRHGIDEVTLLQVDAEGYDDEIVRAVLDAGLRPTIVNYEHCHLPPPVRNRCRQLLHDTGYRFIDVGKDTLGLRSGGETGA